MVKKKGSKKFSAYLQAFWDVDRDKQRDLLVCSNGKDTCVYTGSHNVTLKQLKMSETELGVLFKLVEQYDKANEMFIDYKLNSVMLRNIRVFDALIECREHFDISVSLFLLSPDNRRNYDTVVQAQQLMLDRASLYFDEYMDDLNFSS